MWSERLEFQEGVEEVVDCRDDSGRRLKRPLVLDHVDGFFVDIDAADRQVLRLERLLKAAKAVGGGAGRLGAGRYVAGELLVDAAERLAVVRGERRGEEVGQFFA